MFEKLIQQGHNLAEQLGLRVAVLWDHTLDPSTPVRSEGALLADLNGWEKSARDLIRKEFGDDSDQLREWQEYHASVITKGRLTGTSDKSHQEAVYGAIVLLHRFASAHLSNHSKMVSGPPPTSRALRLFLCHASADKAAVRELYRKLKSSAVDPWLDEEKLLPGQDWSLEIGRAIRQSDAILVCLSRGSVTKAGYVQKEIREALDIADQQPEGAIFLVPVRLDDSEVPERLRRWQWVNLFEADGHDRLSRALRARGQSLGLPMP